MFEARRNGQLRGCIVPNQVVVDCLQIGYVHVDTALVRNKLNWNVIVQSSRLNARTHCATGYCLFPPVVVVLPQLRAVFDWLRAWYVVG